MKVRYASGEAGVMCRRDLYGRNRMGSMRLEVRVTTEPELSPQIWLTVVEECRTEGNPDLFHQTLGSAVSSCTGKWAFQPQPRSPVFVEAYSILPWCGEMFLSHECTDSDAASTWLLLATAIARVDTWLAKPLVWANTAVLVFTWLNATLYP